jgi:NAD+ kinase
MQTAIPPKSIAVAFHPSLDEARREADEVLRALQALGVRSAVCASLYDEKLRRRLQEGEFDALIALGGDGTMLRAGHVVAELGMPLLGINAGTFGFLTELQRERWREALPMLLEGRYRLENRMMLRAEHLRGEQVLGAWDVLNEVVVSRGKYVRPIQLRASVDGSLMTAYVADGLIAATATGSTAYALAVGGPIMPPELRNILIIPVAPHLSVDRAIILSEGVRVTIDVITGHEAVLSVDGQPPIIVEDGDSVRASAGDHAVSFIRFQDPSYFYRNLTMYMEKNPVTNSHD